MAWVTGASQADIVVLVSLAEGLEQLPQEDMDQMKSQGIKIWMVESLWKRMLDTQGNIPKLNDAKEKSVMYNK